MLLINFDFYFQQIYWFLFPKYIKKQMYLYLQWPRLFNLQREKKNIISLRTSNLSLIKLI